MNSHLLQSVSYSPSVRLSRLRPLHTASRRRVVIVRSSLPFPKQEAKYCKEIEAAIDVVERACRLCVGVKLSLGASQGGILEKNDQTPVTIADFGVQALISLELAKLFPSIPLVAEEDSASVRASNLEDLVLEAVSSTASSSDSSLTCNDILDAIDRGGKGAVAFGVGPATYWVLDPIDGTRGFVRGTDALYVVGLALVVGGEIVAGVMGCPNWKQDSSNRTSQDQEHKDILSSGSGVIMAAHIGYGTWIRSFSHTPGSKVLNHWSRCFVDENDTVQKGRFCIPDSQTWDSLPLSSLFRATSDVGNVKENEVLLLRTCCGSLSKYLMVASGIASVFIQGTRCQKLIQAWDHAAGMICVFEAGGKVTDWLGNKVDLAEDHVERRIIFPSGGILVTNGNLHGLILKMISSNLSTVG